MPAREPEGRGAVRDAEARGRQGTSDEVRRRLEAPRRRAGAETQLSRRLTRGLAFACGAIVANLYYAQPLLHTIANGLHTSQASAALLVTITQIAYAAGLLFVVPVGDIVRRRPLFTGLLAADTIAIAASAAAPDLAVLGALAIVIGLTSVVVQMTVPFAATLAADHERGKVIGTLMGGLLTGILLSRTFAGIIAQVAGWRGVYALAAAIMAATTALLFRAIPDRPRELTLGYRAQLRAVLTVARTQPVLRWRALIGACGFAGFSAFWTTVSFLLAGPGYRFSQLEIGLFALAGAAGAAASAFGGRHLDARPKLRWPITGGTLALQLVCYLLIGFGGAHPHWLGLALLVVGALGMDAGVQATNLVNQSVVYELLPQARSRLTSVYMTTMFAGGALGSAVGAHAYQAWGWAGATGSAAFFPALALIAWLAAAQREYQCRSDK